MENLIGYICCITVFLHSVWQIFVTYSTAKKNASSFILPSKQVKYNFYFVEQKKNFYFYFFFWLNNFYFFWFKTKTSISLIYIFSIYFLRAIILFWNIFNNQCDYYLLKHTNQCN